MNFELKLSPFYKKLISVALPITIQRLVSSLGSVIDTLMVAGVGTAAVGAVGAINIIVSMFWATLHGLSSGGGSFSARAASQRDEKALNRMLGVVMSLNIIVAMIFFIGALFYAERLVSFLTKDPTAILEGKRYLRSLSPYFILSAISYSYSYSLRAINKANMSMYISFASQAVNILFNFLLINGRFGFPTLGVAGAAYATVLSKVVEVTLVLVVVYKMKGLISSDIKEIFNYSLDFLNKYIKIALPLALNEVIWSLGLFMYQRFIGGSSLLNLAAYSMVSPFSNFFLTAFYGLGHATLTIVGQKIGEGDRDETYSYAIRLLRLGVICSAIVGTLVFVFSSNILSIYSTRGGIDPEAISKAIGLLRIMGIFMAFKVFNFIGILGILKNSNDVNFLLFVESGTMWIIGVPLLYFLYILQAPIYVLFFATYLEEIIKSVFIYKRVVSKRWLRTLIDI